MDELQKLFETNLTINEKTEKHIIHDIINNIIDNVVDSKTKNIKFTSGKLARDKWSKEIKHNDLNMTIQNFNEKCGNIFQEVAQIILNDDPKKRITLDVVINNNELWNKKKEYIYIITRNDYIMKIGGTRVGMKERWVSYCCGFCVPQRKNKNNNNYPGKMSVTNAYLYHTIEKDLLDYQSTWKFYIWNLPIYTLEINIFGEQKKIIPQTFHIYETCCMEKYKKLVGKIPILCDNCDPLYK